MKGNQRLKLEFIKIIQMIQTLLSADPENTQNTSADQSFADLISAIFFSFKQSWFREKQSWYFACSLN